MVVYRARIDKRPTCLLRGSKTGRKGRGLDDPVLGRLRAPLVGLRQAWTGKRDDPAEASHSGSWWALWQVVEWNAGTPGCVHA